MSGSDDQSVIVWDKQTTQLLEELKGHDAQVFINQLTSSWIDMNIFCYQAAFEGHGREKYKIVLCFFFFSTFCVLGVYEFRNSGGWIMKQFKPRTYLVVPKIW